MLQHSAHALYTKMPRGIVHGIHPGANVSWQFGTAVTHPASAETGVKLVQCIDLILVQEVYGCIGIVAGGCRRTEAACGHGGKNTFRIPLGAGGAYDG